MSDRLVIKSGLGESIWAGIVAVGLGYLLSDDFGNLYQVILALLVLIALDFVVGRWLSTVTVTPQGIRTRGLFLRWIPAPDIVEIHRSQGLFHQVEVELTSGRRRSLAAVPDERVDEVRAMLGLTAPDEAAPDEAETVG